MDYPNSTRAKKYVLVLLAVQNVLRPILYFFAIFFFFSFFFHFPPSQNNPAAGLLVDYLNSTRAKKYFLVLFAGQKDGAAQKMPKVLKPVSLKSIPHKPVNLIFIIWTSKE